MEREIIYSFRVMEQLMRMGYVPLMTLPNPKNPKFNCWVFEWNEEFQKDLEKILRGGSSNG